METMAKLFLDAVRDGDRDAWDQLVEKIDQPLRERCRAALRRAGLRPTPESIEDLTQDVYCQLLRRGAKAFRGKSKRKSTLAIAAYPYRGESAQRHEFY